MRRGQLESPFQWVFVILAGGAFLVFFFILLRGCTQQGEERIQGLSLQAASMRLQSAAWNPDSTTRLSIPESTASCPAGILTLHTDDSQVSLERTPAFLPPLLTGGISAFTRRVSLGSEIPIGNVLYGLDDGTYYLVVVDSRGGYPLLENLEHENIIRVRLDDLDDPDLLAEEVPGGAKTVIIVTDENPGYIRNAAVGGMPEDVLVLGVAVTDSVNFYRRSGAEMEAVSRLPLEHELLGLGAVISGEPMLYRCARGAFELRALRLAALYKDRAEDLSADISSASCAVTYERAVELLGTDDLGQLFDKGEQLASFQNSLLQRSCPVIA